MLVTGPAFLTRQIINLREEQFGHVGREHALIVLGENTVVETAFAELAVEEPEVEQIVAELLAEEPFTAHGVERREQPGLEQLLGRNAGAAILGIEIVEEGREFLEHRVHAALDRPQRMVSGDRRVEVDHGEKVRLNLRFSAHVKQTRTASTRSNLSREFQQPASSFRANDEGKML